jgi:hypothetical protein
LFARWRNALVLVQPETLLRWHRDLFRWFWAQQAEEPTEARLAVKIFALIKRLAMGAGSRPGLTALDACH